jgi:hypothetical protein
MVSGVIIWDEFPANLSIIEWNQDRKNQVIKV